MKLVSLANLEYFGSKVKGLIDEKVDKVDGYGLSKNDYDDVAKAIVESVETGAQVNTVTGVKGSAEDDYRVGNIEITKANIGLGNVDNKSSETIRGELTSANVTSALTFTPVDVAVVGANGGIATLDADGKIPVSQLPSYVSDVIEAEDKASFPTTGESNKIYVALDDNKTYRWSGSTYVEISQQIALGVTENTAFNGLQGKAAYDHSLVVTGNPHNVTKSDLGLSNVEDKSSATILDEITSTLIVNKLGYTPLDSATLEKATAAKDGLMSKEDYAKLANLEIEDDATIKAAIDAIFA